MNKQCYKAFNTLLIEDSPEIEKEAKSVQSLLNYEHPPIPDNFDGRTVWKDYLTPILDQGICGSCYAFSTVSVLADKYAIQSLGQVRPIFNPLEVVMCLIEDQSAQQYISVKQNLQALEREEKEHLSKACLGDSIYSTGKYLFRWGAVEDKCVPFSLLEKYFSKSSPPLCTDIEGAGQDLCVNKKEAQRGWPIWNYYTLGDTKGNGLADDIMVDMMKWGPITMGFKIYGDFLQEYEGKGVYIPKKGQTYLGGHAVRVIGWGTENDVPYWLCANSWGKNWGDNGFFKIQRDNPLLQMEVNHMGVAPQLPNVSLANAPKPFSVTTGLSKGPQLLERKFNDIDPQTFYPKALIPKIKSGELKGNLKPLFNESNLPYAETFWAYRIGQQGFATPSGINYGITNRLNWTGIVIIVIVLAISSMYIYKRIKNR